MFTIVTDSAGNGAGVVESFHGSMKRDRMFERTEPVLRERLQSLSVSDLEAQLTACPVLWSPEHYREQANMAFARVGRFDRVQIRGDEVRYTFVAYPNLAAVRHIELYDLDAHFQRGENGWHRTYMQVREDDLFDILVEALVGPPQEAPPAELPVEVAMAMPELFTIGAKSHEKLVCVMMPFTVPELEEVYVKIDRELTDLHIHCDKASTDLSSRRIIDKVATLIYNADVVICDFTHLNPNVFYEAGLAHAWSKETIFIAQQGTTLPFDTRDEDTILYENNHFGRKQLWYKIHDRLRARTKLLAR